MKNKSYRVSRATLYNTIELLLEANLVTKHQFGKKIAQYEKSFQCIQHDHLVDLRTGKVIEFCDPRVQMIIKTACEINNFTPSHHSFYIYGYSNDNNFSEPKIELDLTENTDKKDK